MGPHTLATVACLVLVGAAVPARADTTNRNLFPIGERETLRSNAGIASASPGSVFHNPAGLARITHPQLSVSGSTYMYFRSATDRLLELDAPVAYEASGFAPIPASLVSTYKVGSFGLATAVLVPDLFQLDNRQRRGTPSARLNVLQSLRRQDLWIGGSLARPIGDRVAVGLSVFGVRRTSISNSFFQITFPAMPGTLAQTTSSESVAILGVTSVLGVMIDPAPWITIGFRVEPPFLQVAGSASIYQATLQSDGMATSLTEIDKDDVDVDQPVPADVGIGVAVRPSAAVTVYLDVALQLGKDYTFVDDPDLGPPVEVELDPAPRASVGVDIQATTSLAIHAGALYNHSAAGRLEEGGDTVEHFVGGSGGVTWQSGRTRTGIGAFFMRSRGELVPIFAAPGDTEPATTTVLGAILTVAYLL
jgi:hypothetical protein